MSSSPGSLQDSVNSFFTLLVFVPVNLIAMAIVWGFMAPLNRVLRLGFSFVSITTAAGLLVFAMMFAWLNGIDRGRGWVSFSEVPTHLYAFTLILAGINVALAAIVSGIAWLVRKRKPSTPLSASAPAPHKKRLAAAAAWLVATGGFGAIPFLRQGGDALADARQDSQWKALADIVVRNDVDAFRKQADQDPRLWEKKLPGSADDLFDELIRQDKVALAEILIEQDKALFKYAFDWDVRNAAMVDMLAAQGMNRDQLVLEVIEGGGDSALLQHVLERHHPPFASNVDLIAQQILRTGNGSVLDLLVSHGFTADAAQVHEAAGSCVRRNDYAGLQRLALKGFTVDPKNASLPYWAIYHDNLAMLQWLMKQPFDANATHDGYTCVEHAIIGGKKEIFEYLLTLKPEVQKMHDTKLHGEANAMLIAERHKRGEMLEALKGYVAQKQ